MTMRKRTTDEEWKRVEELRKEGLSYTVISTRLGIAVSQISVYFSGKGTNKRDHILEKYNLKETSK